LLDENLPQKLRLLLSAHKVVTAAYQGWTGKSNGALIAAAEQAGFDVLVTADQSLNYQQNTKGLKLALVVLSTNKNSLVIANVAKLSAAIEEKV
jgi:alkanesulfonate monooxygenase SsuD/methylene tetrahydromethanopterin reductase-like flavin-dependent oxidoreductase (luciferase family)